MTYSPGWFVRYCGFGLLLGGLSLPFLAGCGGSAPVTAEKSKFQVAGDDENAPEAGKADTKDDGFPPAKSAKKPSRGKGSKSGEEEPAKASESPEVVEDNKDYGASP